MKRYPEYKDSGFRWVEDIPEGWRLAKLKYLAKVRPSNIDKKEQDNEVPVKLCNYVDVYHNEKITSAIEFMASTAPFDKINIFSLISDDLIITKDSETPDDIAVPAYVPSTLENVVCGYHLALIRPFGSVADGNYLSRSFVTKGIKEQFEVSANGITRYGLGKYPIDNSLFVCPPLDEQKIIAKYLDHKTNLIDTLIEKKRKQIELLQEQRSAIINRAVTKGLNPSVKMKYSGIEWLGKVPEHWKITKLKYVSDAVVTGKTPPTSETIYFEDGDIDWFTPGDFNDKLILCDSKRKISNKAIDDGKVILYNPYSVLLVGIGATLGKVGIIKRNGGSNQQINAITFNDNFNPFFGLYYLFSITDVIISSANSATLAILNQSQTKDITILLPPRAEQENIASYCKDTDDLTFRSIARYNQQIELLKEYRTTLISEVVTGKIDVREEVIQ